MTPKQFFAILWLAAGIASACIIVLAIITRQSTGLLTVTTVSKNASISVGQLKAQAQIIGVGSAKVRLRPGIYQVSANNGNKQATALVTVVKQGSATVTLNPTKKSKLPSVDDISFSGTDSLINHGLTSQQLQNLKEAFFAFNASAGKVAIDSGSVSNGPRDRSAPSPIFAVNFKVKIDSAMYGAKAIHSFDSGVELILYDSRGNQVFDSKSIAG